MLEPVYKPIHWLVQAGLPVGYSTEDLERLAELGRRWLEAAGLRRADVLVGLVPPGPNLGFWQLAEGTRRAGVSALLLSPVPSFEDVAGLRPTVLAGRPLDLANLLEAAAEAGVHLDSLHTLLAVGEPLEDGVRDRLEFRGDGAAVLSAWAPPGVKSLWAERRGGEGGLHTSPAVELLEVVGPLTGAGPGWGRRGARARGAAGPASGGGGGDAEGLLAVGDGPGSARSLQVGPVHLDVDVEEGVGRGPARQMGEQVGVDAGLHARPQGQERCPVDQGTLGQVDAGIAAPLAVATLQVDAQLVFLDRPAQEANAAQHEEAVVDRARFTAPAGVATDAHGSSCTPVCRGRTGALESFLDETGDLCHS